MEIKNKKNGITVDVYEELIRKGWTKKRGFEIMTQHESIEYGKRIRFNK